MKKKKKKVCILREDRILFGQKRERKGRRGSSSEPGQSRDEREQINFPDGHNGKILRRDYKNGSQWLIQLGSFQFGD